MIQTKEGRWSWWTFVFLSAFVLLFRLTNQYQQELAWDIFGYYLPLPATFVYDDVWLDDRTWVEAVNVKYHLTDTIYQISSTPDGKPMYFFFLGMSILLLPFFLIGHLSAFISGHPMDGFSLPYEEALVLGATLYSLLGLWYLRKWLLLFLKDSTVVWMLLLLVFATNYFVHGILKNLETVSFLFTGAAMVLYYTHQVHTQFKRKDLILLCVVLAFMTLIKPSECIFALIPLLYGVFDSDTRAKKWALIQDHKKDIGIAIVVGVSIVGIQMGYFFVKTGKLFYDSYINAGVGLDFTHPHFFEALLGYRKGWLLYTPFMLLFFLGLPTFFKNQRTQFWSLILPFFIGLYIVVSWSEYWYGAAYSLRPLMAWYPFLFLVIGGFWEGIQNRKRMKVIVLIFSSLTVLLNLFQYWQLTQGILDPYRTTKEYYWATFLKTEVPKDAEKLKLVKRTFDGEAQIQFPELYETKKWPQKWSDSLSFGEEFCLDQHQAVNSFTHSDHLFVELSGKFNAQDTANVFLALMIKGEKGSYGFKYVDLKAGNFDVLYLTTELRRRSDEIQFYFWNPNKIAFTIQDFEVNLWLRK